MIGGLVLAAGAGTRFGPESKLLADFRGRPLLEWAIAAQCAVTDLRRVVVVLGAEAATIRAQVRFGRAEAHYCESWSDGQAASLRCGIGALAGASRVLVTLGDEPLVTPALIRTVLAHEPPARACFGARPGHPVLLGPAELEACFTLTGDRGARELLAGARRVQAAGLASGRDVDTPEDLEALRDEARAVV